MCSSDLDWLIDAGNTIERIDNYQEWLVRFRTALTGLPEHQRRQSVLPLLHAFAEPETPTLGATMPTAAFRHQVRTANIGSDNDIPHITADLISKYDNDLRQLGLLG